MKIWRRLSRWLGIREQMTNIVAGHKAPDFSLSSIDGKEYSLSAMLQRGPVLAVFFKISCPVCQFTAPFLERLYMRYGGEKVSFLGISQDNARDSKEFANEYGLTFPIVLDAPPYPVSNNYGLSSVPTIFLIEPDGTVKFSAMGFIKSDLEGIARQFSEVQKIAAAPLFLSTESVPANRPG
jgi:peroxiredoxin